MQFTSPYSNKEFTIPDEKLPAADRFSMKCPFTGKKILFLRVGDKIKVTATEQAREEAPAKSEKPALKLPQVEPDVYPPGSKVAFLFLQDGTWASSSQSFFQGRDYYVSTAADELEAIAKLRLNEYDILVAEDGAGSVRLQEEVASWPGGKRRAANVVLVGSQGQSNDPKAAFAKGVNAYLAQSDGAKASDLLEGALTGYELYYQMLEMARKQLEE
ncbi:hypothetical protein [Desulfovibrio ferrophilus]|uniref:Uncharacterized protein n=1 Tax=Desulfovibrio ferrophilus TaxID=241368 RepID=A0A2Z6AX21_9BACT|nr:hypothetical protein [Desulfovibrio ferrophilus]BBD07804.1 uncharacterized protein DFE_1078 [Desulfovibrio ferrophilus]